MSRAAAAAAGAFVAIVGRLPGARRPTAWRPFSRGWQRSRPRTFQAIELLAEDPAHGAARRQRSRRAETVADRRERRRPGANGCARCARLPTIRAPRLRRLPTIQILQIIHGATYVCPAIELAAFDAIELLAEDPAHGAARRQRSRRAETVADRRERRRPGANGCARCARLPTIRAPRLRRLPTIQILQIIHGATYVCARRSIRSAFPAVERPASNFFQIPPCARLPECGIILASSTNGSETPDGDEKTGSHKKRFPALASLHTRMHVSPCRGGILHGSETP